MSIVVDSGKGWTVRAEKVVRTYLAPNRDQSKACRLDLSMVLPKMPTVRDVVRMGGTYRCRASLTSQLDVDDKGCLALSDLNGGHVLHVTLVDFEECLLSVARLNGTCACTLFLQGDKFVITAKVEPEVSIHQGEAGAPPLLTLDEKAVAILYDNAELLRDEMGGEGECCCPLRTGYMELACLHDVHQHRLTLLRGPQPTQYLLPHAVVEYLLAAVEAVVQVLDVFVA